MAEGRTRGEAAAAELVEVADGILADVRRLPPELITWIPSEGVWTVMDNLCHVREFVPFWTGETLRIVRHPEQQWGRTHTDTDRVAAVTNTSGLRLEDVLGDIHRLSRQSADTLRTLSDADLAIEATSKNQRWGLKPASFVIEQLIVHHIDKHRGQIQRNVTQFGERR